MARMMFPELPAPAPVPAPVPVRPQAWRRPLRLLEAVLLVALPLGALIYATRTAWMTRSAHPSPEAAELVRELSLAEQAAELTAEADHQRLVGQHKEALALVNDALALNPNDRFAWFVRLALWCDGEEAAESGALPPEVLEEARRIVKALPSPGIREEFMALAQAHMVLSNLEQSHAAAEKAAGPERDFGPALLISASVGFRREVQRYIKEGKGISLAVADQSLADCDAAIEAMPDYPQAYIVRADIYKSLRSPVRARRDLTRALEIAPQPVYLAMLGEIYADLNNSDAARENYNKALLGNRKLRRAFLGLAALHEKADDWHGVIKHYLEANDIRQTADTFKRLGRAYRQLGKPHLPDARASYEQALNLDPHDAETLAALEELRAEMDAPEEMSNQFLSEKRGGDHQPRNRGLGL
jgi:tetratricopeptide (TPR) repeat protein